MNMRFWVSAVAEPKRIAAQVLTTSPMKVSTLGLMRDSASKRTIALRSTPQARPKALVQERHDDFGEEGLSGDGFAGDAFVVDEVAADIRLWPREARHRGPGHRGWWTALKFQTRVCRWACQSS